MLRFAPLLYLCVCACGRVGFASSHADSDCSVVSLADAQVNVGSRLELQVAHAVEPVDFTLEGPGAIEPGTSTFISPAYRSTTQVTAIDAAGCTATATITTGGAQLFYIAGSVNAVPRSEVWRSTDANAWTLVGNVPDRRVNGAGAVFHDALWYIGGSTDESMTGQTNVWTSTDGVTWTDAGAFPAALTDEAAIAFHDRLWVIGGHGNPGGVWSSADGTAWTRESTLPVPAHGGELVVLADQLVYMGGHDDTNFFDTAYASADGKAWSVLGHLPSAREFQATDIHDATILFAGGTDAVGTLDQTFVSTDAMTWTAGGALPAQRLYTQLHWFNGRFYNVGGTDGGDIFSSVDGASWRVETTSLVHPRYGGALLEFTPH